MKTDIVHLPQRPTPGQNHVVWGQIHCVAKGPTHNECSASSNDWSGLALENVVFQEESASAESLSGKFSERFEKDIKMGVATGKSLVVAGNNEQTVQEFLIQQGVWSAGATSHAEGLCKPCHFVHTTKGCKTGTDCTFCHMPHANSSNHSGNRPSKEKRAKCKQLLRSFHDLRGSCLDEAKMLWTQVASQSVYMQKLLSGSDSSDAAHDHQPAVQREQDASQAPSSHQGSSSDVRRQQDSSQASTCQVGTPGVQRQQEASQAPSTCRVGASEVPVSAQMERAMRARQVLKIALEH